MFKDRDWISYDTIENIQKRAAYVVANNLGGLFVWSCMSLSSLIIKIHSSSFFLVDMDDFSGSFCNNGSYPYIKKFFISFTDTYVFVYLNILILDTNKEKYFIVPFSFCCFSPIKNMPSFVVMFKIKFSNKQAYDEIERHLSSVLNKIQGLPNSSTRVYFSIFRKSYTVYFII